MVRTGLCYSCCPPLPLCLSCELAVLAENRWPHFWAKADTSFLLVTGSCAAPPRPRQDTLRSRPGHRRHRPGVSPIAGMSPRELNSYQYRRETYDSVVTPVTRSILPCSSRAHHAEPIVSMIPQRTIPPSSISEAEHRRHYLLERTARLLWQCLLNLREAR